MVVVGIGYIGISKQGRLVKVETSEVNDKLVIELAYMRIIWVEETISCCKYLLKQVLV